MNTVTVNELEMQVRFAAPWTIPDYQMFIRTKALPEVQIDYRWEDDSYTLRAPSRFATVIGATPPALTARALALSDFLFDYQRWIVEMALRARRFAVWADCGLGKTPIALEWARHVSAGRGEGRVAICAPAKTLHQWREEVRKFYGDTMAVEIIRDKAHFVQWCRGDYMPHIRFALVSHHLFVDGIINECRLLAGFVLDESSILKSGGGVIKWNLIKSCRGIEFKLSCTATPAPNDMMEYASQASWLEKLRNEGEILWTFFNRDQKTQQWKIKPHAREAFYRFMSSWSIYLRKPSAYGFHDPFADVPEPEIIEIKVDVTDEQAREAQAFMREYDPDSLIPQERLGVRERSKLSQIAKGFVYVKGGATRRIPSNKPQVVADLVRAAEAQNRQGLVWTVFDEESDIIMEHLADMPGVTCLTGSTPEDQQEVLLDYFCAGKCRQLVSKAQLLGYGLNFQFCTAMIFSGFDDSFERFYQAVRRCYRYGSKEQLKVYVPYIPSLENHVWENVLRKKTQWETDTATQEQHYREALKI